MTASPLAFRTADLIAAAETAIKNHDAARVEWDRRVAKFKSEHRVAWFRTGHSRVRQLRDKLTAELKSSGPVERVDVYAHLGLSNSGDLGSLLYVPPTQYEIHQLDKPAHFYAGKFDHAGLLELLKAHTGDEISASQLKSLGYAGLVELFRDAVKIAGAAA